MDSLQMLAASALRFEVAVLAADCPTSIFNRTYELLDVLVLMTRTTPDHRNSFLVEGHDVSSLC